MLKKLLLSGAVALALVSSAKADFVNGGFETGDFSGWTPSFLGGTDPVVIQYGQASGYPSGAFGESVPAPVGGGSRGAYFSSDTGIDELYQVLTLPAGDYTFSLDIYAPRNGLANPSDAFYALIAGSSFLINGTGSVKTDLSPDWLHVSLGFTSDGSASGFGFGFIGLGSGDPPYAADVVVDNFSIAAVPEPSTWAMMLIGMAGLGYMAFRRKSVSTFA